MRVRLEGQVVGMGQCGCHLDDLDSLADSRRVRPKVIPEVVSGIATVPLCEARSERCEVRRDERSDEPGDEPGVVDHRDEKDKPRLDKCSGAPPEPSPPWAESRPDESSRASSRPDARRETPSSWLLPLPLPWPWKSLDPDASSAISPGPDGSRAVGMFATMLLPANHACMCGSILRSASWLGLGSGSGLG